MISYPGEILARFGRYEAVEDLGPVEKGHLWRVWDPFLERFVLVAALPALDRAELHKTLRKLDQALKTWLGGEDPSSVLDFGPGGPDEPPYFVFPIDTPTERPATSPPAVQVPAEAAGGRRPAKRSEGAFVQILQRVRQLFGKSPVKKTGGRRSGGAMQLPTIAPVEPTRAAIKPRPGSGGSSTARGRSS